MLKKDLLAFEKRQKGALSNVLIQLKKCVNHPYMFDGVEPEPFEMGEHLVEASAKLSLLDALLRYLKANGHRVLIFSQMTRMLDILQGTWWRWIGVFWLFIMIIMCCFVHFISTLYQLPCYFCTFVSLYFCIIVAYIIVLEYHCTFVSLYFYIIVLVYHHCTLSLSFVSSLYFIMFSIILFPSFF